MRLIRKLHNQRGVSLLVSLVFFLVCAMVAAVILGSATTNAEKLQHQQEEQQVYYSVSSAAQLLRDKVDNLTITGSELSTQYECSKYYPDNLESIQPERHTNSVSVNPMVVKLNGQEVTQDALLDLLSDGVKAVYMSTLTYAEKKPFTSWKGSFTIADGKNTVDVTVSIDENYTLTFQLVPEDQKLKGDYSMTLICAGKKSDPDTKTERGEDCTHTVTIKDLYSGKFLAEEKPFPVLISTRTTTISWEPGMIYKGANGNG